MRTACVHVPQHAANLAACGGNCSAYTKQTSGGRQQAHACTRTSNSACIPHFDCAHSRMHTTRPDAPHVRGCCPETHTCALHQQTAQHSRRRPTPHHFMCLSSSARQLPALMRWCSPPAARSGMPRQRVKAAAAATLAAAAAAAAASRAAHHARVVRGGAAEACAGQTPVARVEGNGGSDAAHALCERLRGVAGGVGDVACTLPR
jgi:hypothetical protein